MTRTVSATREEQKETAILDPNSANAALPSPTATTLLRPFRSVPEGQISRSGAQKKIGIRATGGG
eukprot:513811-Hanusia_phi.AAC.2